MPLVEGVVEVGDRRGRLLGYPTANVALSAEEHLALEGVWAGLVEVGHWCRPAAVSVGRRRTFYGGEGQLLLEAHLLDTDVDLYGQHLRVHLHERLRGQRAFPDKEALVDQLHADVCMVREWALARTDPYTHAPQTRRATAGGPA